jgi:dihydrofolate reductase
VAAFALAHPDRVNRLIYVSGTGIDPEHTWKPAFRRTVRERIAGADAVRRDELGSRERTPAEDREYAILQWSAEFVNPATARRHAERMATPWLGINWDHSTRINAEIRQYLNDQNVVALCPALAVATLIIDADQDPRPRRAVDSLHRALPNARRVTLAGAGHLPWVEDPDGLREAVARSAALAWTRCTVQLEAEVGVAKLICSAITSLDGYIADERGEFDWGAPDGEVHAFINDLERPIGTYLYGRRLYETMVFWETAPPHPDPSPVVLDYATIWRAADKIVYSTTLPTASSARTRIEPTFAPHAVRAMKDAADHDLSIGGPTLAAHAFRAGLVDEVRLFVSPLTVGGGKPLLPDRLRLNLHLQAERSFGNGVVYLQYRVSS